MLLSIIIPVYNVEKYLASCLDSCLHSVTSTDYEIIIVNDGSKDNSAIVAKEYARKYCNIYYFEKENGGLGSARNMGLSVARGDYIWFVDSDDSVTIGSIDILIKTCSKEKPDIIAIDSVLVEGTTSRQKSRLIDNRGYCSSRTLYDKGFLYPYSGAPFYIVNKSFLHKNNISFVEGLYYEDMLYTPLLLSRATTCYYLKEFLYVYYVRSGSITQSVITLNRCEHHLRIIDELYKYLGDTEAAAGKYILKSTILKMLSSYYHYYYSALTNGNDRKIAKHMFLERKYLFWIAFKSLNAKSIIRCIQVLLN